MDDGIVDDVAQDSVTPDNSQDINIKEEDMSVKDDAAEPIVQMDKKGDLIFMCNICHTYKGTVDLTRKYQEELMVSMNTYVETLIVLQFTRPKVV